MNFFRSLFGGGDESSEDQEPEVVYTADGTRIVLPPSEEEDTEPLVGSSPVFRERMDRKRNRGGN